MYDPNVNNWYHGGHPPWGIWLALVAGIMVVIWAAHVYGST